jgi:CheY-like chemotaxis protein
VNLPSLLTQFQHLQEVGMNVRSKAKRGLAFERFLGDLFRHFGILMTDPFRITGEQIDGACEYKGWVYLVEAKWQDSKKSTDALYAFQGKVDRRIEGSRGLFISMSGYHVTSVHRFSEGRKPNMLLWSGEHIEAVLKGEFTIPELIDASVRHAAERSELLLPLSEALVERTDRLFVAALEASSAQVDSEISAAVGRKFIPKLYVERHVERDIDRLIHPERELENIIAEFLAVGIEPPREILKARQTAPADPLAVLGLLLDSLRSRPIGSSRVGDVSRLLLDVLPINPIGRMHIITSRAGMGKTNLLCHLAKSYAKQQPTVFLTGRSGITAGLSITALLESKFSHYLRDPFPRENCFQRLVSVAQAKGTSVLVIIDAINEHKDFDVVNAAIAHLLHEVSGLPVVVLASCRDVYWPFFDTSLWPRGQWKLFDRKLDLFSVSESNSAIVAYFDFYHITARLSNEAEKKLSHPLILRFFCEAYGNPSNLTPIELHEIPDIRLKVLFDEYLTRKLDSICHTAPQRFRTPRAVQEFLFRLADRMRAARRRDVPRDDIPTVTADQNLESPESTYVSILGEDILLEEQPDAKTGLIQVVFTYDEFMEYMLAQSMLRNVTARGQIAVEALIEECQNGANEFHSLIGVLEYVAVILKEEWQLPIWDRIDVERSEFGSAVCRAIGKLGAKFVGSPEIESLEKIAGSRVQPMRLQSVQRLQLIVWGEAFDKATRMKAIDVLLRVVRYENDVVIRSEAVKCFEKPTVVALSASAHKFDAWLSKRKRKARSTGLVFSEDEPAILKSYGVLFSNAGWREIFLCETAEETLKIVKRVRPALVVTDMNKPRMSGRELAKALKDKPSTGGIPILLVSASPIRQDEDASLFCGVLEKPCRIDDLLRVVELAIVGKYND